MLALSIRQPYAELILRGIKTVEYRSRATTIIGRRFWIYASKGSGVRVGGSAQTTRAWSNSLVVPGTNTGGPPVPLWMVELARQVRMISPEEVLPTGVIVGSAVIERVEEINDERGTMNEEVRFGSSVHRSSLIVPRFRWHLTDIERAKRLRKPTRQPQPVWFRAF